MAPEVMEQAYDERSDVWSLGCVLLEMTTTAIYSQDQIFAKLTEIKTDAIALEEVYDEIAKV
jgi:probable inactive protein kinase-like protein SgK071